jgi:excisionase family DNA binding protein
VISEAAQDWRSRNTIRVEEVAPILGISRSSAYDAARSGEIPTLRIGRRLLVPVLSLRRMLGEVTPDTSNALVGENQGAATTSTAGQGRRERE